MPGGGSDEPLLAQCPGAVRVSRYAPDSKERVRDAVDMVDLVSAHTDLRRAGAHEYTGLCPFHEERTPSFGINPLDKVFHCFGCGASGDVFSFVMQVENVDFAGALELLADRYGVELEREQEDPQAAERRRRRERLLELLGRTAGYYERCLWESAEAQGARDYLATRGLGEAVLRDFGVGYAPSAWDRVLVASRRAGFSEAELLAAGLVQRSQKAPGSVYDRFRARIAFPLRDARGRVLGFGARALRDSQRPKYLNTSETAVFHKGAQLFGLDRARAAAAREGTVVVVEGYTDVLALHQAGIVNSVGIMGTALTEEQVTELARLAPTVCLALDADAAGQEAMVRASRMAEHRRLALRVVPLPAGSDPAELIQSSGAEAMRQRLATSIPFVRFHVQRILDEAPLDSAEARDAALERVRPLLAGLAPGLLREELIRVVASRLDLSDELVASLAGTPGQATSTRARVALDRREGGERTFLALCIALPEHGREALRRVSVEQHFTSELVRAAARHLRDHSASPLVDVPSEPPELAGLIAELSLRAAREPAAAETLEVELLRLEKERLEREIAAAQAAQRDDVIELATQRAELKSQLDRAMDIAMERSGRVGEG